MSGFLPDGVTLLKYTLACFVLFATPGPDMSLFLAKTMAGGRRAGIASMLGASAGCLVHTILAALGLSLLIAASPAAFATIRIVGALYLLWLAIAAIRQGSALNVKADASAAHAFWKTFLLGLGINLTNPKVVLFFITFLPLFVAANDPEAGGKLVFLGLYFVVINIPLGFLMIVGAERLVRSLKSRPKLMRAVDYVFAGVFGAFAVSVLTTASLTTASR